MKRVHSNILLSTSSMNTTIVKSNTGDATFVISVHLIATIFLQKEIYSTVSQSSTNLKPVSSCNFRSRFLFSSFGEIRTFFDSFQQLHYYIIKDI
ncbi:hypothetical protein Hanom_Chr06g00540131 [Helianthus anomalus]